MFQGPRKHPILSDLSLPHTMAPRLLLSLGRVGKNTGWGVSEDWAEILTLLLTSRGHLCEEHSSSGSQLPHLKNGSNTRLIWGYEKLKEKSSRKAHGSVAAPSQWSTNGSISSIALLSEQILPPLLGCEPSEGSDVYWTEMGKWIWEDRKTTAPPIDLVLLENHHHTLPLPHFCS